MTRFTTGAFLMGAGVLSTVLTGAGMAHAHPGHVIEVAGHGHWIAAGALAAAAALAALLAAKGRKAKDNEAATDDEVDDAEPKEA